MTSEVNHIKKSFSNNFFIDFPDCVTKSFKGLDRLGQETDTRRKVNHLISIVIHFPSSFGNFHYLKQGLDSESISLLKQKNGSVLKKILQSTRVV